MPYNNIPSAYHFSHKVSYAITIHKRIRQLVWLKLACTLGTSWTPMEGWIIGELPPCFLAAASNGTVTVFQKIRQEFCLYSVHLWGLRHWKKALLSFLCLSECDKISICPIFCVKYIFMLGLLYIYVNTFLWRIFVYQERGDQVLISNMPSNLVPRAFPFICSYFSLDSFVCVGVIDKSLFHTNTCWFFFSCQSARIFISPTLKSFFCRCFFYLCITSAPLAWRAVVTGIKLNISTENGTCTVRGNITCDLSTDNWNAFQSPRSYRWFRTANECHTVNRRKRLISFKNL